MKLSKNVKKRLFESNNKYRTYFLEIINTNQLEYTGMKPEYYNIKKKDGSTTPFYHEQLINGKWVYVEEIPQNAYVSKPIPVKIVDTEIDNKKQGEETMK